VSRRSIDPRVVACPQCGAAGNGAEPDKGEFCKGKAQQVVDYHRLRRSVARAAAENAEKAAAAEPPPPLGPSKEQLALQLLVIKALSARVAAALSERREAAAEVWRVGDNVSGYLTEDDAKVGKERSLGRVGMSSASKSWKVRDVEKLTAWVEEHHPTEIERRPIIRNSFLTLIMGQMKADDGVIDKTTGEKVVPPGIELDLGSPSLTVSVSKEADDLITEALASGLLRADGTLAIEAAS
jgi:hypothetical protein